MLNRLLQPFYRAPNNGRQVLSTPSGRRLLVTHADVAEAGAIGLCSTDVDDPQRWNDFDAGIDLVGCGGAVDEAAGFGGCALVDGDGTLHLAWSSATGIQHATAPVASALQPDAWSAADAIVAADAWLGDLLLWRGRVCATFRQAGPDGDTDHIGIASVTGDAWTVLAQFDTPPTYPPVAHADDDRLHLAWGDVAGRLWYVCVEPDGAVTPPTEPLRIEGRQPSLCTVDDGVLLVYEDRYPHVHYLVLLDGQVTHEGPVTYRHPWFMGDLVHSPQLSVDRHGVAWCFFVDNTRRSTFWARWMGDGFGDVTNGPRLFYRPPHFDWNLLPVARLSLEKHVAGDSIGMALGLEPPLQGQEFRRVRVPNAVGEAGSTTLFLDGLDVAEMRGVDVQVQEAVRHEANPLLDLGPPGAFDCDRVFNHGAVLNDGDRYRMWYGAIHEQGPDVPWWDTICGGYAESADGIAWRRVDVGADNRVDGLRHSPLMVRDDADPDPQRRYKSLYLFNSGEMGEMAATGKYGRTYDTRDESFPAILFTSPDGLTLTPHEATVRFPEPTAKPFTIVPQSMFRDNDDPDPQRRWKAYGFITLNLRRRGGALLTSPDAITWTAHPENPLLDPSVRGVPAVSGGPESQIHDTVVFPYAGQYVALYQYQHDAGHLDIELAVSRDGETFTHVQPGAKVIPLGAPDAFDAEHIVQTMPVVLDSEIRIYYGGGRTDDVPAADRARRGPRALTFLPGLATLRRDGFTRVGLREGLTEGLLRTLPFVLDEPCWLSLNAACDESRRLHVEVRQADTRAALDGFAADESTPITGDGIYLLVTWGNRTHLPAGVPLQLVFHFRGDTAGPQLFAYRLSR